MAGNIYIVDDDKVNLKLISDSLLIAIPDIEIQTFASSPEALDEIFNNWAEISLIVLDAHMPDLNGFDVCRKIKSSGKEAPPPILMISGAFTDFRSKMRGMGEGADSYLCKPFDIEELIAQVKVLIRVRNNELKLLEQEKKLREKLVIQAGELEEYQGQFQTIFNYSPDAIFVENEAGIILDVNPAACALHDSTREKLIGSSVFDLIPVAEQQAAKEHFSTWFNGKQNVFISKCLTHGGGIKDIEISGTSIDYNGEKAALLHVRDISNRLSLENQVRSAQKMDAVGRLAGGVAHDFNNLLTTVLGYSHLIMDDLEPDSNIKEELNQIVHAANRASSLTRQLLMFSRRQMQPLHPVALNEVVRDIDKLLRRTIGENIELVTNLGENIGHINSDEGQLEQIIINITINAKDSIENIGKMYIETSSAEIPKGHQAQYLDSKPGDYCVLSIRDTGAGIPEDIQEHMFEPFYSTKDKSAGAGLGLSTVYGIIQYHQGFFEVNSNPGEGTEFKFYFPKIDLSEFGVVDENKEVVGGDETILLVEDEHLIRKLTAKNLEIMGYSVVQAANGSEGLRIAQEYEGKIDLIVSDVVMPHMGGPEMVSRLRKTIPEFKLLFISGFTDDAITLAETKNDPQLLLTKPYTREELGKRVRVILDK